MTLRLVLLDLDDTLMDHRAAVGAGIAAHLVAGGLVDAADEASARAAGELWNALEEEYYHHYLAGELTFLGQRRARVRAFLAAWGSGSDRAAAVEPLDDDATDAWFRGYLAGYEAAWSPLPGAHAALDGIERRHPGVRFGIVTNGERHQQEPKLERTGFAPRMGPVVCSGDLDFAKPDPRIFLLACAEAGVHPADGVMVGDRLRTDATGAISAGLGAVWLDASGDGDAEPPAGVVRITALDQLPDAVDAAHARR